MASILQQISTPLQLVALCLLLLAGIARLLAKAGNRRMSAATNRLVVERLFQAAIVALVLGVTSSVIAPLIDRLRADESFHGAVLSDSGDPIAGATIDVITIGAVETNALGQFDLAIPHSRALKEYRIQVKAVGYQPLPPFRKSAEEMRNLEIRMIPAPLHLVRALDPDLVVAQYYGMPLVVLTFQVENPGSSTTPISEIRAKLVGDGIDRVLSPLVWTILNPFGPFEPVVGPFPIFAKANLNLRVVMAPGANFASLFSRLSALPEYKEALPCAPKPNGATDALSDDAFAIVKNFADEHFVWKTGPWRLKIDTISENQTEHFEREFVMSASDVQRLQDSIALVRQCLAVNISSPLAQEGGLANFVTK